MISSLPLAPLVTMLSTALLCMIPMRRSLMAGIALGGTLLSVVWGAILMSATSDGTVLVSLLGGWEAPFGIVMTADRLSALMSTLASVCGVFTLWFMISAEDKVRERHHLFPLTLLLFTGVQQSFLTGDLFNLFVAFEVMLVASYALSVLGSTREQLREGFRYIVMNLAASSLLVVACGLAYGVLGTLNFAHLAQRSQELGAHPTVGAVAVLLMIVFASKAALFPMGFWLPGTYPALPAASSAFFAAILTKVGIYALIRTYSTLFQANAELAQMFLLSLGAITMIYGALGALSQKEWRRVLSFTVMSSVGYLSFGIGLGTTEALRAALSYIAVSILTTLALFLIAAVAERASGTPVIRDRRGYIDRYPLLAAAFMLCALTMAGLPPTGGFVAKYALIRAGLLADSPLALVAVICALTASLITLYTMLNIWRDFFWGKPDKTLPCFPVPIFQKSAAYGATCLVGGLVLGAGALFHYTDQTAQELSTPSSYIEQVLPEGGVIIPSPNENKKKQSSSSNSAENLNSSSSEIKEEGKH